MPAQLSFFDMAVTISPPNGHFQAMPLTLGASWQPNDIRILMVSGSGAGSDGVSLLMPMRPDPPTGFTAAFDMTPGQETYGVFWRRLQPGDVDTTVAWPKPPQWRHFNWTTLTIRGASPTVNPIAGRFNVAYTEGDTVAITDSISVPGPGTMVFSIGSVPDPAVAGSWPSWAVSMGVPSAWTHLVATEKSGIDFDSYNTDPNMLVIGQSFLTTTTTGAVPIPVAIGKPGFSALYVFVRPAADVSASLGAV